MVKGKKKDDPPRPAARQKKPGMPSWYKDLFSKNDSPNFTHSTDTYRADSSPTSLGWPSHWCGPTSSAGRSKSIGRLPESIKSKL